MTEQKKLLEVKNLSISFQVKNACLHAIRGVGFSLYAGKTLAIVGESGSGKSVSARAIMGILSKNERIDTGHILLYENAKDYFDILSLKKSQIISKVCGNKISMIFQDPMTSLNPTMTIGNQIMEGLKKHQKLRKKDAWEKAVSLLEEVGITQAEKRMKCYPHQLSGGMRQRVVIAIALSCDPDILICDEPTTSLDVTIQAKILNLLIEIQKKKNLSILFITHDFGVVAKIADDVAVMYAGKIVEQGTAEEIFYDPRHPYTRGLLSSVPDLDNMEDKLYSIPGTTPNLLDEVQGEVFAQRNPYALNIDFEKEAPSFQLSETHTVASWLLHEKAPEIEVYPQLTKRIHHMLAVSS